MLNEPLTEVDRDTLVLENRGFVITQVTKFLRTRLNLVHLRDDLIGSGFVKLTDVAGRFARTDSTKSHFINYLRRALRTGFWDTVRSENGISKPRINDARRVPYLIGCVQSREQRELADAIARKLEVLPDLCETEINELRDPGE